MNDDDGMWTVKTSPGSSSYVIYYYDDLVNLPAGGCGADNLLPETLDLSDGDVADATRTRNPSA